MLIKKISILMLFMLMFGLNLKAEDAPAKGSQAELEKVADKLIDPLSDLWFVFMTDYLTNVTNTETGNRYTMNQYMLQPVMPYTIKKDKIILVNRPSFLVNTLPNFSDGGYSTHVTNFSWSAILGYKTDFGLIYGAGPEITFPAYNDLSSRNFKTGGTAILYYMQPKFVTGFNYTHFVDLETRDDAKYTNSGILQYVFTYRVTPLWSITSASQVEIIYTDKGMKYNLPLGLSVGKTLYLGKVPASISVGYQYVVKNNDIYLENNIKQDHRVSLTLMTVVPNLFHLEKFQ